MFTTAYEIAFLIIGIFGSLTTIFAFIPQFIKTMITKDTSGLSLWFFIIALISSLFWLTTGSLSIASPFINGFDEVTIPSAIASGLPSIITNIITLVTNSIILIIKINNMKKAKALNMSEQDYCATYDRHNK